MSNNKKKRKYVYWIDGKRIVSYIPIDLLRIASKVMERYKEAFKKLAR